MRKQLTAAAIVGTLGVAGLTGVAIVGNSALASAATESSASESSASESSATESSASESSASESAPSETESGAESSTSPEPAPQTDRPDAAAWILDKLAGLVADGTITDEQAQEVAETLAQELPGRGGPGDGMGHRSGGHGGFGGPGFGGPGVGGPGGIGVDLDATIATALGLTEDEVRTALRSGSTIADLAEAEGVDPSTVVDALVSEAEAALAGAVTAGDLDQARADEISADLEARVAQLVENGRPDHGDGPGRGMHGGRGADETDDTTTESEAEQSNLTT